MLTSCAEQSHSWSSDHYFNIMLHGLPICYGDLPKPQEEKAAGLQNQILILSSLLFLDRARWLKFAFENLTFVIIHMYKRAIFPNNL